MSSDDFQKWLAERQKALDYALESSEEATAQYEPRENELIERLGFSLDMPPERAQANIIAHGFEVESIREDHGGVLTTQVLYDVTVVKRGNEEVRGSAIEVTMTEALCRAFVRALMESDNTASPEA